MKYDMTAPANGSKTATAGRKAGIFCTSFHISFERFSTSSEARKVKTPSRISGIYITAPVSRFSGMKSLFGKKPFTVTGRRYPAVRSAEIMSTAGIIYPNAPRPASPSAPTQR